MDNEYKERAQKAFRVLRIMLIAFIKAFAPIIALIIVFGGFYLIFASRASKYILYAINWLTENPKRAVLFIVSLIAVITLVYIFVPPLLKKKNLIPKKAPAKQNNEIVKTASKRSVDNYKERSLLTETENKFYRYLINELKDYDVTIHPKVRLEDLVSVRAETKKEYMQARGYVKSRHIDFILCDSEMALICGIEVDDASHQDPHAKEIDEFKDNIFRKLGKELYRIVKMDKLEEGAHIIVENLAQRNLIQKKN